MRGTLLVVTLAVVALAVAVAWHEFAVGLQGYGALPRDGELATWSRAPGPNGQTLTAAGPPDGRPVAVPLPPGPVVLEFDTLMPGILGRLFALEPLVKLSGARAGPDDAVGFVPLHGGTDGCWQILDLTGALGRLVATPGRISMTLDGGRAGRVVVREGRPELGAAEAAPGS